MIVERMKALRTFSSTFEEPPTNTSHAGTYLSELSTHMEVLIGYPVRLVVAGDQI